MTELAASIYDALCTAQRALQRLGMLGPAAYESRPGEPRSNSPDLAPFVCAGCDVTVRGSVHFVLDRCFCSNVCRRGYLQGLADAAVVYQRAHASNGLEPRRDSPRARPVELDAVHAPCFGQLKQLGTTSQLGAPTVKRLREL
jgi:hypothetical protein